MFSQFTTSFFVTTTICAVAIAAKVVPTLYRLPCTLTLTIWDRRLPRA